MPRGSVPSEPYEKGKGLGGLETHFSKCPFCGRKILVQVGLFGVSHNLGVIAVCGDCIREKGVDPKYRAEDPSTARRIEAWARPRPKLRGPPAGVAVRRMRDDRSRRISAGRIDLSDKAEPEDPAFTRPTAVPRNEKQERTVEALRRIKLGQWTVRRAAEFAGLAYQELLDKMSEKGIDSGPTLNDLREALEVAGRTHTEVIGKRLRRGGKLTDIAGSRTLPAEEWLRTRKVLHNAEQITPAKLKSRNAFLLRRPRGKSGLGDLSEKHDEYFYWKKRIRASS